MPTAELRLRRARGVVDPIRRVRIPRDLAPITGRNPSEVDPESVGMTAEGVERIWSAAQRLFRRGMNPAVTLCVRRHGAIVLDRSLGWARGVGPGEPRRAERVLARPDTPFCTFSASKAVTATVVQLLAERGTLRLHDRVVDHLPEFTGQGRDEITLHQLLCHRAGIPRVPRELMDLDLLGEPDGILGAIAQMRLAHRPGAALAYHTVSGGFILGEVVRRVTGRDIRAVLATEILDPLGFRWTNYGVAPADLPRVGLAYPTGPRSLPPVSTMITRALGMPIDRLTRLANDPRLLTGIVPAGNVVSTANEMSRFMDLLRAGGTLDGVRILRPATIRRAVTETSYHQIDRALGAPIRYGVGFMLGARALSLYGPDTDEAFGHLGFTNVAMWADPRRELSVGLITSGKPVLGPHLGAQWGLVRRIGLEAPKVERPVLFDD